MLYYDSNTITLGVANLKHNLFRGCGQHIHGKKNSLKKPVRKNCEEKKNMKALKC
jgi:hypothetical protein